MRNEVKFWAWYLVVGLLAGIYAHDVFLTLKYPVPDGIDINLNGMVRVLTYNFVTPFIKAFAVLSAVRFFILLIALRRKPVAANHLIKDELAARLGPLRDHLPDLLSQAIELQSGSLRQSTAYPVFDQLIDFLASGPTPQQIIAYQVAPDLQERLEELLDKNREAELTEAAMAEMNAFRQVNHVLIRLKASARRTLQSY